MVTKRKGYWLYFKPRGSRRWYKAPQPFATANAAWAYVHNVRRTDPKGIEYKVEYGSRPIQKALAKLPLRKDRRNRVKPMVKMSKAARSRAAKKAWRTRKKRYGKDGKKG